MHGEFSFGDKPSWCGALPEPLIKLPVLTRFGYQNFDFLVDTGADASVMPADMAELLNIDLEDCEQMSFLGIGRVPVKAHISAITVKIFAEPLSITCAFSELENSPFLLGRKDIFSQFSLLFDNARKFVRFSPLK